MAACKQMVSHTTRMIKHLRHTIIIAERLSTRQLLLHQILPSVCMLVCVVCVCVCVCVTLQECKLQRYAKQLLHHIPPALHVHAMHVHIQHLCSNNSDDRVSKETGRDCSDS